jgi:hypothetical protein
MTNAHALRAGALGWWRDSPTSILAGEVVSVQGSIVVLRRCGLQIELHTKRVHARWRDAKADSPLPAAERNRP